MGIPVERNGNAVYVHLGNQSLRIESPGQVNLTHVVLTLMPLERLFETPDPMRTIHDLEMLTFDENLSTNARKLVRLYAALLGLKHFDRAPDTVKEGLILTVARLIRLTPEEIVTNRAEVEQLLRRELEETLGRVTSEELETVLSATGVLG